MRIDCFTLKDLDRVFTLDVYSKDSITFMETHLPLDKIHVKFPGAQMHELKTEQDIINTILTIEDINTPPRIFVITGDTGTGKSEECRLIAEAAEKSGKFVVEHKDKKLLSFGPLAFMGKDELINTFLKDTKSYENILTLLLEACKILLIRESYEKYWDSLEVRIRSGIRSRLNETAESIKALQENPDIEIKPFMILESVDFRPFLKPEEGKALVENLNKRLVNVLISILGDFSSVVDYLEKKTESCLRMGKRYMLVMDDVTLLGPSFSDILNLITHIGQSGINCDVVFGITRGRYSDISSILDTLSDRAFEIQLTNMNLAYMNASWLLDECLAINMLRKYLKALKDRNRCGLCKHEMCKEIENKDLFPFNETFLRNYYRLFRQLAEKSSKLKFTPRMLLSTLKSSLVSLLQEGRSPANRICQEWENVEGFIDPARVWLRVECPDWMKVFIRTCYLYGEVYKEEETEKIKVKKSIVDFFNFDIISAQDYLGIEQDGDYIILTREKIIIKEPKELGKEKIKLDLDSIVDEIRRWMNSPNTSFGYTLEVKEGFNTLLKCVFKDKMRIIMNPDRLAKVEGLRLEWKHRRDDVFPFSIGFGKEKNEIKLIPTTIPTKESNSLTLFIDDEDLLNIIKLKYDPENVSALSEFIFKHPELVTIGQKCREVVFSQIPEDFMEWILASIIILGQLHLPFNIRETNIEEFYQLLKNFLSKSFEDPILKNLRDIAFSLFTVRESIMDYVMVKNVLSRLMEKDLISIVLQFDSRRVESIGSVSTIIRDVQTLIDEKTRSIDRQIISNRASDHMELVNLAKEMLQSYQQVQNEVEKLNKLRSEPLVLPDKQKFEELIEGSRQIEKLTKENERTKLENLILLDRLSRVGSKHSDVLKFLVKIRSICSQTRMDESKRYRELTEKLNSLRKEVDELVERILNILGE